MLPTRPKVALVVAATEPAPLALRDDDALMQLACAGAPGAFEQLVRRHQGALRSFCARHCGSGVGDEIAQEVLLTVWHARGSYEPRGKFRAYLFTIADRRCRKDARSRSRATRATRAPEGPPAPDTPLDSLLVAERRERLHRTLQTLPAEQQRAILLRYAGGLEYDEIADVVKRPSATARSRVFLGLARLRKLVTPSGAP